MKLKFLVAAVFLTTACQTYDFEPVEPLAIAQTTQARRVVAKQLKPNLMLLVDKSGSMDLPVNVADSRCQPQRPNCTGTPCGCGKSDLCPAACPTRWSELQKAMGSFLTGEGGTLARFGLTAFPTGSTCEYPTTVRTDLYQGDEVDAKLREQAVKVNQEIQGILSSNAAGTTNATGGGTPTGLSLRTLGNYAPLNDENREDFVLLLTDGLPNCNDQNPNDFCTGNQAACRCTIASGCASFCKRGCLDKDGTVAEVRALLARQIKTIVVGFGADTASGDGREVLNALAESGGFARACPKGTDAECAPGTCVQASKLCTTKYYQAADSTQLITALQDISKLVGTGDPCVYNLEATPSDPRFLTVLINNENKAPGPETWTYSAGKVTFTGALCTLVSNATPNAPVMVEFRIVEGL